MGDSEMVETEGAVAPLRTATVNHPSLKDAAAAYIREQILTGKLTPGTKIDQDEISEALGMSRLPVREALIELAQESLIDAVPRSLPAWNGPTSSTTTASSASSPGWPVAAPPPP
jgi:DNA-binding FadR family transcriptional regulator